MKRYFSVDCEFTGLDHTKYDLASIGIIEISKDVNEYNLMEDRKFYIQLKPLHKEFNKDSMKINGLNFSDLYKYGAEPKQACKSIIEYLDLKEDDEAIFIGYCNVLDKIYTDQLFLNANMDNPFHYETIEISSLAIGKLNLEWGFTESELENKLGIASMTEETKHNALEDAIHQGLEFVKLMNMK